MWCPTQQIGIAQTVDEYAFRFIVLLTYRDCIPSVAKGFYFFFTLYSVTHFAGKVKRFFWILSFFLPEADEIGRRSENREKAERIFVPTLDKRAENVV